MGIAQNFNLTESEYQRLQQGDQRLQTKVFDKYALAFVNIATGKYGLGVEDAEEIVSSAFAKLFYKILSGTVARDNLQGYVYTIVKHKCFDRTEQLKKNIVEMRDTMPDVVDDEPNDDLLQLISAAFGRLGDKCQKLLGGFYWENKDHKELADEWGITEDASRQRKRECMKKLRLILRGEHNSDKPLPC